MLVYMKFEIFNTCVILLKFRAHFLSHLVTPNPSLFTQLRYHKFNCWLLFVLVWFLQSTSSQSLPAEYHPPGSVSMTTDYRPHPSSTHHKSYLYSSEVVPLASSTLLKLSPPSLSGSTSSLNSIKSTKSAQEFSRLSTRPSSSAYPYTHTDTWSTRRSGQTSTPKPKSYRGTSSLYQPHLSSSSFLSLSTYPHSSKPPSLADTAATGSKPLSKRPGSASGYQSVANRGKQPSSSGGRSGEQRAEGMGAGVSSKDPMDGKYSFCY